MCVFVCVPDRQHSGIRSAVTFGLCVQILCVKVFLLHPGGITVTGAGWCD